MSETNWIPGRANSFTLDFPWTDAVSCESALRTLGLCNSQAAIVVVHSGQNFTLWSILSLLLESKWYNKAELWLVCIKGSLLHKNLTNYLSAKRRHLIITGTESYIYKFQVLKIRFFIFKVVFHCWALIQFPTKSIERFLFLLMSFSEDPYEHICYQHLGTQHLLTSLAAT